MHIKHLVPKPELGNENVMFFIYHKVYFFEEKFRPNAVSGFYSASPGYTLPGIIYHFFSGCFS